MPDLKVTHDIGQSEAREMLHALQDFIRDHEQSGFFCAGLNAAFMRAKQIVSYVEARERVQ